MTIYLVDENVLREMQPGGHANVVKWAASVSDSDLRLSAITFLEKCRGWELRLKKNPDDAAAKAGLDVVAALRRTYAGRILPIDEIVVAEWAKLLGAKGNNALDVALAATARVHGLVVATRNVRHFVGRGVDVLDPFHDPPLHHASQPDQA